MKGTALFLSVMLAVSVAQAAEPVPSAKTSARPDWFMVDQNYESAFFYDRAGVVRGEKGVMQVTTRILYTDLGKAETQKVESLKQLENLFETRFITEVSCGEHKSRLQRVTHLDDGGKPIKVFDLAGKTDWEEIPPGSRLDKVAETECR